jgi:hypothetical protein
MGKNTPPTLPDGVEGHSEGSRGRWSAEVYQPGTPYARALPDGPRGACACDPTPATIGDCTCPWGALLDQVVKIGYNTPDRWQAARDLAKLQDDIRVQMANQRSRLLRRLARDFTGTRAEFCERLGFSTSNLAKIGFSWRSERQG